MWSKSVLVVQLWKKYKCCCARPKIAMRMEADQSEEPLFVSTRGISLILLICCIFPPLFMKKLLRNRGSQSDQLDHFRGPLFVRFLRPIGQSIFQRETPRLFPHLTMQLDPLLKALFFFGLFGLFIGEVVLANKCVSFQQTMGFCAASELIALTFSPSGCEAAARESTTVLSVLMRGELVV